MRDIPLVLWYLCPRREIYKCYIISIKHNTTQHLIHRTFVSFISLHISSHSTTPSANRTTNPPPVTHIAIHPETTNESTTRNSLKPILASNTGLPTSLHTDPNHHILTSHTFQLHFYYIPSCLATHVSIHTYIHHPTHRTIHIHKPQYHSSLLFSANPHPIPSHPMPSHHTKVIYIPNIRNDDICYGRTSHMDQSALLGLVSTPRASESINTHVY